MSTPTLTGLDLRVPANPSTTGRRNKVMSTIRRLAGRPRWPQEQPYLTAGNSYRTPDRRRRHTGGSSWIHTHR